MSFHMPDRYHFSCFLDGPELWKFDVRNAPVFCWIETLCEGKSEQGKDENEYE